VGDLNVTTTTTGSDLDPDGYTVTVDGGPSQAVGVNGTVTFTGLAEGDHTVELTGLAGNCAVSGANPSTVTVLFGGTATTTFAVTCEIRLGDLAVTSSTTGQDLDPDGYTVTVDGGPSQAIGVNGTVTFTGLADQAIGVNGTVTFTGLAEGDHAVELTSIASNCSVSAPNPRIVTVPFGGTATTTFAVACVARVGDLDVAATTTGSDLDPDGYTVTVDGGPSQAIGVNGTVTFTGLADGDHAVELTGVASNCTVTTTTGSDFDPDGYTATVDGGPSQAIGVNGTVTFTGLTEGDHTVELTGVASNCTVSGANPRTVTVPFGGTATTTFAVGCVAPFGDLIVTTNTTGSDPDPDGYTVTLDGTTSQPIATNGSVTFAGVSEGLHSVQLTGMAATCTVVSPNPQTANVPPGGTAFVTFDVGCGTGSAFLVQTIETWRFFPPSPDPAGITYLGHVGTLLISDSEVNEMSIFMGVNLFETSLSDSVVGTSTTTAFSNEPTGVSWNPTNHHLFVSDDDQKEVFEVDPGPDRRYGTADDIVTSFDTAVFGSDDPEGVTYDSSQGVLFIADGLNAEVYRVSPGNNGVFDGVPPAGDDQVTSFDTAVHGLLDPEGIAYDSDSGHLYIAGEPVTLVFHMTTTGTLLRTVDISAANARRPAGLAFAPSSVTPGQMNLWIVDRGVDNNSDPNENDGKVYEFLLP
jgi:hypothetical protein